MSGVAPSIGFSTSRNNDDETPDYPFCLPSYIPAFDDGLLARQELEPKGPSATWRSERFPAESNVLVLDHNHGQGRQRYCNDAEIVHLLAEEEPQVRFVVLLPTPVKCIASQVAKNPKAAKVLRTNELYDKDDEDDRDFAEREGKEALNHLNISHRSLLRILTSYDIAPAACSHVRGQEQVYGSRTQKNKENEVTSVEFWFAIRARAYYREVEAEADLKITALTKYNIATHSTLVILKYRSFNDLPDRLKREQVKKLREFVDQTSTAMVASNPFAISLLLFNSSVQWYRRAARDPRDAVRLEEEKAHENAMKGEDEREEIDLRQLHLTIRSLDQDKVQLSFILGVIARLRKQQDIFYSIVYKQPDPVQRDGLYLRVDEEFDRLENQIKYFRSSIEDVSNRAERLLNLLFSLSAQKNARWSERVGMQSMYDSAAMKAIAIVSMLFLPGTYVSTILGTNLFYIPNDPPSSDSGTSSGSSVQSMRVASQWWILLITTVFITSATFAFWIIWKTKTEKSVRQKLHGYKPAHVTPDVESGESNKGEKHGMTMVGKGMKHWRRVFAMLTE